MTTPTWLEAAKRLPLGHKTRLDCPNCGSGTNTNAMMVNHDLKAYSANCFACGHNPFEMKGKQTLESLAELKRLNNEILTTETSKLSLPDDATDDIPLEGRLWLYTGGITPNLARQYGIKYSPRLHRVILPVYDTKGTLIWFQCRALREGQKPKYLQPSRDKTGVVFTSTKKDNNALDKTITVVEDIMSAIRVGEVTRCASLLGTKADTAQINYLSTYDICVTWLDSDSAGKRGAYAIRQAMGMLAETRNVRTPQDPKKYSKQQIEGILCSIT